jgi:hypothetical protein
MRANIEWVRPEDGGRAQPPSGEGSRAYATMVKFGRSNEPTPPSEAWSLVVEKLTAAGSYIWEADVRFLSKDAPVDLLTPGRPFELYEGQKRVATGTLL